jgi:YdjC-like protein
VGAQITGGLDAAAVGGSERRIWLCADDYGISAAVNTAIRDLVVRRRLNATSAMVVAPSFQRSEAVALDVLNSAAPRVAIGLHLTLTAPFRPLSKSFKPLREGAFLPLAAMAARALMHQLEPDVLAAEITRLRLSSRASAAPRTSSTAITTFISSLRSATPYSPSWQGPRRMRGCANAGGSRRSRKDWPTARGWCSTF